MLQGAYSCPKAIERARRSWLLPYIESYFIDLAAKRFKRTTLTHYANQLFSFGEFLERQDIRDVDHLLQWIEPFVDRFHPAQPDAANWRSVIRRFVRHLEGQGIVCTPAPLPNTYPHAEVVAEYTQFLQNHRGLCSASIRDIQHVCQCFVTFIADQGVEVLNSLQPHMIHQFITREGKRLARTTLSGRCYTLRGFLRHLFRRGALSSDMASVVVAPRVFTHEQCPRFLTRAEVEAVLAVIDRESPRGPRDYAMLLLLSVYGLRGLEVVRLRLDDIDWRKQQIRIRLRKAGNNTVYPLSASVGEAIIAYLREGRPASAHREVFLTIKPPFCPFASSMTLCEHVQHYIAKAGIQIARPGMHTFRYSCAQRLLEKCESLKTIADYLGHRSADSTQRYTQIAIDQLRAVASGDGEDLL